MAKLTRMLFVLPLAVLALAACNPANTTLALPTTTPIPTVTVVSTVTPILIGTAESNAIAGSDEMLLHALKKTMTATSYRMALDVTGKGAAMESLVGKGNENKEVPLLTMTGEFRGADGHYTLRGLLSAILGTDSVKGFEGIVMVGKAYVHGPVPLLGAKEDKWYVLTGDQIQAIKIPLKAVDLLGSLVRSDINLAAFKLSGTESVDDTPCDVFTGDKGTTMRAIEMLSASGIPGTEAVKQVQSAELKFWACHDGFLHRIQLNLEAGETDKPDQQVALKLNTHLFDFNASIAFTAPEHAEPLQHPELSLETVTPQP